MLLLAAIIAIVCLLPGGCRAPESDPARDPQLPSDLSVALKEHDLAEAIRVVRGHRHLEPELYAALELLAKSDDSESAFIAVTLLGRIPDRGQYSILQDIATNRAYRALRCQALYSMGLLRDPHAAPFLLRILGSVEEPEYDRWVAASSLEIIRDGIVDEMPMRVWGYVLTPVPGAAGPLKMPSLESLHAEFVEWWEANSARLLSHHGDHGQ